LAVTEFCRPFVVPHGFSHCLFLNEFSTKFHAVSLPSRTGGDFFSPAAKRISNIEQGISNDEVNPKNYDPPHLPAEQSDRKGASLIRPQENLIEYSQAPRSLPAFTKATYVFR
jgi:hypothetical protein